MATRKALTQSEREAYQAERNAKIHRARSLLEEGLTKLQTSDDWQALLERIAKNIRHKLSYTRYSFGNQILLWIQAEHVSAVATFETWKRVGRSVKKGEKALYILQPRPIRPRARNGRDSAPLDEQDDGDGVIMTFRPLATFDVTQTEGEPLEEPPKLTGEITAPEPFEQAVETLREVVLSIADQPVSAVEVRARQPGDSTTAFGWFVPRTRAIVVIDTGNRAQMLRTLIHETAHAILHGAGDHHDAPTKEVEAESVAFIVSHVLGLQTEPYSFPYIASWARGDDATKRVRESGERIHGAARCILDALLGPVESLDTEAPPTTLCA